MYVSHIELQNWKNFNSASADLSRRTFLIGPNASGKSNLLDAFRFLRDVAQNGLAQAIEKRGGVSKIRCLAARKSPSLAIDVTLSRDDGIECWRYRLEFSQDRQKTPRVKKEVVENLEKEERIVSRPNEADTSDEMLLTQTSLEQILANRDFRGVAEFFENISYQHVIPQVIREPQEFTSAPVRNDPFGRDVVQRIWNTNRTTRTAWLNRISSVLKKAVPQLKGLEVEMDDQGTAHLIGRFEHWRAHDARQNESQFSDGTLRLFGLMWAMFDGNGPLLLEEPELSLHPEVVRQLPGLLMQLQDEIRKMRRTSIDDFEPRQLIISTHSDELLRDKGISADEIIMIKPDREGSILVEPDEHDREALRKGMTAADILLPKVAPGDQLALQFAE